MLVRPEETSEADLPSEPTLYSKVVAESLVAGCTFMRVVTVGLNVLRKSLGAAFSIAALLPCMIYALGDVSGAYFTPAVTVSLALCGMIDSADAAKYMGAQLMAGALAALLCMPVNHGADFPLGPRLHRLRTDGLDLRLG